MNRLTVRSIMTETRVVSSVLQVHMPAHTITRDQRPHRSDRGRYVLLLNPSIACMSEVRNMNDEQALAHASSGNNTRLSHFLPPASALGVKYQMTAKVCRHKNISRMQHVVRQLNIDGTGAERLSSVRSSCTAT